MHHEDLLQGEIKDLEREILALKNSANVAPYVKCYVGGESTAGGDEWLTIFFKDGDAPIITEIVAPGCTITALTPTQLNGVDIQSVHLTSQSWGVMDVYSTRPIDHITRA